MPRSTANRSTFKQRARALNDDQRAGLMRMLEANRPMARNELPQTMDGRRKLKRYWEAIARKLNVMKGGSKTPEQWRKTWDDLRARARSKHNAITACLRNGQTSTRVLNDFDLRVIELMSKAPIAPNCDTAVKDEIVVADDDGNNGTDPFQPCETASVSADVHPSNATNNVRVVDFDETSTLSGTPVRIRPDMDEEFLIVQREKLELLRRMVQLKEEKRVREAEKHDVWMRLHATDTLADL